MTRMKTSLDNSLITNARQVRIETVLGLLGARPSQKEAHKWYCPVHGGSSFHVWTEPNPGMCFGCGKIKGRATDPIDLIMAVRGPSDTFKTFPPKVVVIGTKSVAWLDSKVSEWMMERIRLSRKNDTPGQG